MNGPPSSGQHVSAGSRSSRTSRRDALDDRPALHAPRADLEQLAADVARAPQLAGRRRQQRLGQLDEPPNQPQRPLAERQLGAARGAEQIGDQPEVGALDVGEEQRRTAGGDHAAVDLRRFEMRIDRRLHRDEVVVTAKLVDERAEIGKRHGSIYVAGRLGVGAGAVDVRHLRAHRAQVRGELAAVMDAVVVGEADELHARPLHHAEEVERSASACRPAVARSAFSFAGNVFL